MEIVNRKLSELTPYDRNPRKNDEAVKYVKASIEQFGFKIPIIIDAGGTVVAGHTRMKAAKELGMNEVPCIVADDLTPDQIKAFRLADNKTAEMAEWDDSLLQAELIDLIDNFDMADFGFEINPPIGYMPEDDDFDADAVVDAIVEPVTKLGDIWTLGRHRLMCGDSTDRATVDRLMDGAKADMVFTDPPYGVDYKGINNDDRKGLRDLLDSAFENMKEQTKDGGVVYCFHSDKSADIFHEIFRKHCHFSSMIIWKKPSLVLSQGDYQSIHEPCLYGWFDNGTHEFYGDRKQTSVWECGRESVEGHTTPKPTEFIQRALENSGKTKETVLDLFGGSGSTLIACEQLNRTCFMMELDPKYCDVIIKRWETLTGQKAVLLNG